MGIESKNKNGGGGEGGGETAVTTAVKGVPATVKRVVQSVKEIVNCTEQEIYAVLKECDMDPNRAVEKLLAQDTFHEVRSKREKRKEMKEAVDSRTTRVNNVGLSRGGKNGNGSDRSVVQSRLTPVTYNEHGKAVVKREAGSVCASVTSSLTRDAGKSLKYDPFSADNGRQSSGTSDSGSDCVQVSAGPQPLLIGASKAHLSMADIVRMGRASRDDVSHTHHNTSGVSASGNSESSLSLLCQNNSEQQDFHDDWPVIEQPITGNSQALNMSSSLNADGPCEHPNLHVTGASLCRNYELDADAAQVAWRDVASDNAISEKIESAISGKHTIMSGNTGLELHSDSNLKNTCTSDSYHEHHEDVSSVALDFQRLSMRESKLEVPSSEDNSTVVLPNHLQALAAECSHLSFGTYNGGSNSAILASNHLSRSGLEEKSAAVDDSLAQFLDASSVCHGDKQLGFDVLRGTVGDQNSDILSSPRQEHVKHTIPEQILGHDYNTTASVLDPSLQKSLWVTSSVPLKQPGLQSGSHSPFRKELHVDPNSIPSDVLAFLMSQSQRARYSNAESFRSNLAVSMAEVTESGAFALHNRSELPHDVTVQSSAHLQQLPDMKGYHSLPQNQSYMTSIGSQQAFSGHAAYNQSFADIKYNLSKNRNELLMNRLPHATANDAFGYGNLGSSVFTPGSFLSNTSCGYMKPSSNLDEILPSQYNGGRNLSSIQQQDRLSQWAYGAEPRSSFLPERTQHNFLGQPNQASMSQYVNPGYSDHHHPQKWVSEELQQPDGFQDLSSKQSHQFWQPNH